MAASDPDDTRRARQDDPPAGGGAAPRDSDADTDPSIPAPSLDRSEPPRVVAVSRSVVLGGDDQDGDGAIELDEEADAGEESAPVDSFSTDVLPSAAADRRPTLGPASGGRSTPMPAPVLPAGAERPFPPRPAQGLIIPVPPPFVPCPEAIPRHETAQIARRPAVAPPPPPEPVPSIDSQAQASVRWPPASSASPAAPRHEVGLPRVIISEEAFRPSSPPPSHAPSRPTPPALASWAPADPGAAIQPSPPLRRPSMPEAEVLAAVEAFAPPAGGVWSPPVAIQPADGAGIEADGVAEIPDEDVAPAPPDPDVAVVESGDDEEESAALAIAEDLPPMTDLGPDTLPSVISIPEDDVPRRSAAPSVPQVAPGPPPAGRDRVEEIADEDVQTIEPEVVAVVPPPGAPPEAAAAVGATTRAPLRVGPTRRRRRRGARKSWWEEVFDEEYLRSLPKFTPEDTRREVDLVQRVLGVEPGGVILDLACGHGRHAVELAARGYEVVGVDLSLPMLARAGEAAQQRGVKINFIQGCMRELQFEAVFDAAYCVGTSFGYFDDETNAAVARNVWRALKPSGVFLLETCNRDHVIREMPRSTWFQGEDRQYLEEVDFNYITSRLVIHRSWALPGGDQESADYSIRLYSLHELGMMLHSSGFRVSEVTGHYATPGVFFGSDSARLITLAEKR
ncbi:MAG: methyltransferase domain-containing protein [Myxococcota bacterium]|nr:methyltransferase domain-containing protein [Myxococcota bacterium]